MSTDDRVPCFDCDGAGRIRGLACTRTRSRIVEYDCSVCGGTGKVSPQARALYDRGEVLRDRRLALRLSLREFAAWLGIPPVELGEVEHGRAPAMLVARVEALAREESSGIREGRP